MSLTHIDLSHVTIGASDSRPGISTAVDMDIQRYYPGRIVTNDTYLVRLGNIKIRILAAIVIVRLIVNRAIADIKNEHVSIQRME